MIQLWALTDYRVGTANQVLGVARHTNFNVIEQRINYNKWARLPNVFMFGNGLRGVEKNSRAQFESPWPDVVIAAGRRAAPIATYIKHQNPQTKLVHLMHPNMTLEPFDLLVLPSHDMQMAHPKMMTTLGAPHSLSDEILFAARARVPLNADRIPRPWTLLCLGGNTSHGQFTLAESEHLVGQLAPLAQEGSILLTASRRTPPALMQSTLDRIHATYPFVRLESYSPQQSEENPYHAWLAQADRIVVTADSVSMISEAAYTAKALYVFTPSAAASPKHQRFVKDMVEAEHVKMLDAYNPLWRGGIRLDEARKVARRICGLFGN